MTALAVHALAAVRAAGGDVKLAGPHRLKIIAPMPLPNDLIERVRMAKPDLLDFLYNEPAAGAPRTWAEALARLDPNSPPHDVPLDRWQRFIEDCESFRRLGWANLAEAFGWEPLELFGCDRERPLARYDHMGLLWFIQGRRLVALRADSATIDTLTGSLQTYPRMPLGSDRIVLAWELAS